MPGLLLWAGELCLFSPCRMFVAQQITSSNLLLLVTDAACDCSVFPPVPMDAKEVKYILPCRAGLQGSTGPLSSVYQGGKCTSAPTAMGWRAQPGWGRSPCPSLILPGCAGVWDLCATNQQD